MSEHHTISATVVKETSRRFRAWLKALVGVLVFSFAFTGHWSPVTSHFIEVAYAEVPQYISYQGKLMDATGDKAVTRSITMTFRLYDASTGGTELWKEEHSISLAEADKGLFNVVLGSVTALSSTDFNTPMWLSVQVTGDSEMTPRQRLTASGYALNADKLDSLDSTKFLRTDVDTSTSGKLTITRAGAALLIKPSSDPAANTKLVEVQNAAGTSKFSVDLEGDVLVAGDLTVTGTIGGSTSTTGTTNASWTIGSGTDATASDVSVLFGKSSGQESIVFDGDSTDDFVFSDDISLSTNTIKGTTSAIDFSSFDVDTSGNVTLAAQADLRLADSDSSNYLALQAPATVTSNVTWTLPSVDGTSGQILTTNGSGTLSWASDSTGTGDITDVFNCSSGDCASVTMADGDLLSAASVNPNTTTEGIILPQATSCSSATAEGQICWDTDGDSLYLGTGSAVTAMGTGNGDVTDVNEGNYIDVTDSGGPAPTIAMDPAEVGAVTWLDNADRTWTFDIAASGTNPTGGFSSAALDVDATVTVDDLTCETAGCLSATELGTDSVASDEIAADAVGTSEIATDGVGSAEIAADAVGTSEIATDG